MAVIAGGSSQPNNPSAIAAAAAFIFMFSLFFPTGFLGLTFLYAAEIAPLSHRSSITAISTSSAWLFNFVRDPETFAPRSLSVLIVSCLQVVAEITPVGFSTIGYRYPIVYACINLFLTFPCKSAVLLKVSFSAHKSLTRGEGVYFLFPETNGRHLEEVDMIFTQSKSIFDTVAIARELPRGRGARAISARDADKNQGELLDEKGEGLEPVAMHDGSVVRSDT